MTEAMGDLDPMKEPPASSDALIYFLDRQRDDPDFLNSLADRLYEQYQAMKPVERRILGVVEQHAFPDDLEARQRSTKAYLLARYVAGEIALAAELEATLNQSTG